ncbi:MAG: hypothetical protein QOF89_3703 [Acidobacteriota bacterium]|jgi:hypothetical protein|nr:hypothetical protein [Acidobacteriota bacterium]
MARPRLSGGARRTASTPKPVEPFRHAGVRRRFGLRVLDRAGSSTERDPQALEAPLELEAGKLEQLGRLPEVDLLVEVIAEDPGFQQIAVGILTSGAKGESPQEPVVESVQEDDALLPSARNDGKLSLLDPVQDLSGPLGQVGGGDDGSRHESASS